MTGDGVTLVTVLASPQEGLRLGYYVCILGIFDLMNVDAGERRREDDSRRYQREQKRLSSDATQSRVARIGACYAD